MSMYRLVYECKVAHEIDVEGVSDGPQIYTLATSVGLNRRGAEFATGSTMVMLPHKVSRAERT